METFIQEIPLIENSHFEKQRAAVLNKLDINEIDTPIKKIILDLSQLPFCFPMQSCYGHFFYKGQKDPKNIEPLPQMDKKSRIVYRIAYIALCIQNSTNGKDLLQQLQDIPSMNPDYIQFGCAEWFWERQINSYALQVEPARFMTKDGAVVGYQEALHIEKIKDDVFVELNKIVIKHLKK